ncbi:hypothetical protein ILUMI_05082 [Ignelater luminosus]|uniref:Uncharacterized protein n=1 Tax=Ignelater luminosus TaxID=2038154 RepID=A0A8K0GKG6_IGNLU|nr:hypothetical protein ILUMI_05082 [Ignelater luminosus]
MDFCRRSARISAQSNKRQDKKDNGRPPYNYRRNKNQTIDMVRTYAAVKNIMKELDRRDEQRDARERPRAG